MVEIIDKREGMANQLLMRGHASMLELLTASFGEWPPKGLDINPKILHDQQVQLNIFKKNSAKGKMFRGQAVDMDKDERFIDLKETLKDSIGLNTTLGHESVHILQGDNAYRKADTFKKQMNFIQRLKHNLFGQHDATSNIIMNELAEGKEMKRLYAIEFNRVSRTREQQSETVRHMNYLRLGVEVQARIHEVIIAGYPAWGKVPTNIDEFYAAMKNAGFKMPPEIEKRLESLPENSSAHAFLSCKNFGGCKMVAQIQQVGDSFSQEGTETFWNKVMPALYADLITLYGDTQGGQRLGLGSDLKAAVSQKTAPSVKQTTPSLSS